MGSLSINFERVKMIENLILFSVLLIIVVLVFAFINYLISRRENKKYEKEFISQIRRQTAKYDRLNSTMIELMVNAIITSIRNKNK